MKGQQNEIVHALIRSLDTAENETHAMLQQLKNIGPKKKGKKTR